MNCAINWAASMNRRNLADPIEAAVQRPQRAHRQGANDFGPEAARAKSEDEFRQVEFRQVADLTESQP